MFKDSELLDRDQARDLYFCIPLRETGTVNDCSSLVYNSRDHHLSVTAIHQALDDARHSVGNHGIIMIGKSGAHVFGAYSHLYHQMKTFIMVATLTFYFQLQKDLKIPYNGRNRTRPPTLKCKRHFKGKSQKATVSQEDGYRRRTGRSICRRR